jgi:hypothetical protein
VNPAEAFSCDLTCFLTGAAVHRARGAQEAEVPWETTAVIQPLNGALEECGRWGDEKHSIYGAASIWRLH